VWELHRAQHHQGVESEPAGGAAENGLSAIALGGFPLQVFAACLDGGCDGPPLGVTRHDVLRRQRAICRQAILVAMGPCTVMDLHPMDCDARLPAAVPGPCAGDHRDVSGGASRPRHHKAGARGCVRHDFLGGGQLLAFDAGASQGPARARWWRLVNAAAP
jgi:hypothetical protein